jgi:uncharacterized protein
MNSLVFDWDDANIGHIAEHGVTPEEAEDVLLGDSLDLNFQADEGDEERWSYLGQTNSGRILQVVITLRGEKIRVVTAFDASRQDKALYLETKAEHDGGFEDS